jgi:hypothetical protein
MEWAIRREAMIRSWVKLFQMEMGYFREIAKAWSLMRHCVCIGLEMFLLFVVVEKRLSEFRKWRWQVLEPWCLRQQYSSPVSGSRPKPSASNQPQSSPYRYRPGEVNVQDTTAVARSYTIIKMKPVVGVGQAWSWYAISSTFPASWSELYLTSM